MESNQSTHDTAASDEDDEWEYEYDYTETEDYYVTLDMTTYVPIQQCKRKRSPPRQLPEVENSPYPPLSEASKADASPFGQFSVAKPNPTSSNLTQSEDEIKIHDLHTDNPIIFYQDQIFSCHWGTTLGTELLFVKPSPKKAPAPAPRADQREGLQLPDTNPPVQDEETSRQETASATPTQTLVSKITHNTSGLVRRPMRASNSQPRQQPQLQTPGTYIINRHHPKPHLPSEEPETPPAKRAKLSPKTSTIHLVAKPATLTRKQLPPPTSRSKPQTPAKQTAQPPSHSHSPAAPLPLHLQHEFQVQIQGSPPTQPRPQPTTQTTTEENPPQPSPEPTPDPSTPPEAATPTSTNPAPPSTPPTRRAKQTLFLHKFQQAKKAKGEVDEVAMWTNKGNHQHQLATLRRVQAVGGGDAAQDDDEDVEGDSGEGMLEGNGDANGEKGAKGSREQRKNEQRRARRWRSRVEKAKGAADVL